MAYAISTKKHYQRQPSGIIGFERYVFVLCEHRLPITGGVQNAGANVFGEILQIVFSAILKQYVSGSKFWSHTYKLPN